MDVDSDRRIPRGTGVLVATVAVVGVLLAAGAGADAAGTTERVSVSTAGELANGDSGDAQISADGRCVAFFSAADNLVEGDTNNCVDIFVRDREIGETTRVSVASNGAEANGTSEAPSISADGRYVAFDSVATNLVSGDTNGWHDVFVHDRRSGQTTRVSVASDGTEGQWGGRDPSISADGRYVAFASYSSNLVHGDTNAVTDVFVHDRRAGQTMCVSVGTGTAQAPCGGDNPAISATGRYVAFESLWRPGAQPTHVVVRDRHARLTTCVSVASNGVEGNSHSTRPAISADGRHVAFVSVATNFVPGDMARTKDFFVHDRLAQTTTLVAPTYDGDNEFEWGPGYSRPAIGEDGRYVAFQSFAWDLIPGDNNGAHDVFVHDQHTGQTSRVSVSSDGQEPYHPCWAASMSADGRYVSFESCCSTLAPGPWRVLTDVFVHDRHGEPLDEMQVDLHTGWTQCSCGQPYSDQRVFGEYLGSDLLGLWTWNPRDFCYEALDHWGEYASQYVGQGMWALATADATQTIMVREPAPANVSVGPGWNLLANPFAQPLDLQTGLVPEGNGSIHLPGYHWNPEHFAYDQVSAASPGWSFWVLANYEGLATFDPAGMQEPGQCGEVTSLAVAPEIPDDGTCIQLVAEAGGSRDRSVWFGITSGSRVLTPKPPVAPNAVGAYLDVADGIGYARSIVPHGEGHVWTLTVSSPAEERVTLRIPDTSMLPGTTAVWLTDLASGRKVDLRRAPGYDYTAGDGQRRFEIELAERDGVMQVTAVSAQPAAVGAQISFTLSAAGSVTVDVLNIAGRTVKRVVTDHECVAGPQGILWHGLSDRGTRLPDGAYLVRVTAVGPSGEQSQGLATVMLR